MVKFLHRYRFLLLGVGLAGLHNDDFFVNLVYVVITGAAIMLIADKDQV